MVEQGVRFLSRLAAAFSSRNPRAACVKKAAGSGKEKAALSFRLDWSADRGDERISDRWWRLVLGGPFLVLFLLFGRPMCFIVVVLPCFVLLRVCWFVVVVVVVVVLVLVSSSLRACVGGAPLSGVLFVCVALPPPPPPFHILPSWALLAGRPIAPIWTARIIYIL